MVLSVLDPTISYKELKAIEPNDQNMDADLYASNIMGVDVIYTLGQVKMHTGSGSGSGSNLVYFPIYLVKYNDKIIQIGVIEMYADDVARFTDENGDLDVQKTNYQLLYSFVNPEFLEKNRLKPDNPDEANHQIVQKQSVSKEQRTIHIFRADIFKHNLSKEFIPSLLEEETKHQANDIKEKYHESETDIWINKFMKNPHYSVLDNEGNGDCLFATIRDAFASIGQDTTVEQLRNKLSKEVDSSVFNRYKEQYTMYANEVQQITKESSTLKAEHEKLKSSMTETLDTEQKKQIKVMAKNIKDRHEKLKTEISYTKALLAEFQIMKNVNSVDEFKKIVQSCDFWADEWAISTMERVLNIKFIMLSTEKYQEKDYSGVLLCGSTIDPRLEASGEFTPDYYIIVEYTGNHYKLVQYKKISIFQYKEIPHDLKHIIVDKCLEKQSGIYAIIPDFNGKISKVVEPIVLEESRLKRLYDDNITFCFYSKSAHKPLPGKGNGESLPPELSKEYAELSKVDEWRKKLDNFWIQPFTLDNRKWSSVEHYYQASKFRLSHPSFYAKFSLDYDVSETAESWEKELAQNPEIAKGLGGKLGKYDGKKIRPKDVNCDNDFFSGGRADKEMFAAQYAKFSQHDDLKTLLQLTKNAKLVQYRKGREPKVYDALMLVRDELKNSV